MFKSVFAKYETAFMTIITSGFALLLLVVTSIVGNYSSETRAEQMQNTTEFTVALAQTLWEEAPEPSFSEAWTGSAGKSLQRTLAEVTEEQDLSVFVTDTNGTVLCSLENGNAPKVAALKRLPGALFAVGETVETDPRTSSFSYEGMKVQFCLQALTAEDGAAVGWVVVGSYETYLGHIAEDLSKTVITSALLVLLAAMIVAYFLTARITDPLREMSSAARDFAAGKFDARVRVQGRDEVSELAEAFNQMADSLENLENMRNSFIANVSHDLRTPMTTIAGFIDGIRDGVIPPEEQDRYLQIVSIEVQRLSRLVSALLDLSRIQAGDRKFVMRPFDICEMGRLILISFEKQIEEKALEVVFECDAERMMVNADHDAIYQVFYNLCHNALKFASPRGLLRIRICEAKGKKVTVSVYNDGQGIPAEDLQLVFERFYKSDKSRGLDKTGVGLGLFITKTIITAHGEKIWAESEYGKNCEFTFTLSQAGGGGYHLMEG